MALEDFMVHELNMPTYDIESMSVVKMFFPKKVNSRVLYVEFSSEYIVQQVYRRAKNIPVVSGNQNSIEKFIPKQTDILQLRIIVTNLDLTLRIPWLPIEDLASWT